MTAVCLYIIDTTLFASDSLLNKCANRIGEQIAGRISGIIIMGVGDIQRTANQLSIDKEIARVRAVRYINHISRLFRSKIDTPK